MLSSGQGAWKGAGELVGVPAAQLLGWLRHNLLLPGQKFHEPVALGFGTGKGRGIALKEKLQNEVGRRLTGYT